MDPQLPRKVELPATPEGRLPSFDTTSDNRPLVTQAQVQFGESLQANRQEIPQKNDGTGANRPPQFEGRQSNSRPPSFRAFRPRGYTASSVNERNNSFARSQYQNQNHGRGNGSLFKQVGTQQFSGDQQITSTPQRYYNQQAGGFNLNTPYGLQSGNRVHFPMIQEKASVQNRLFTMSQMVSNTSAIPRPVVSMLTAELGDLSKQHEEQQNIFRNENRLLLMERDKLTELLSAQKQLTQNAMAERDRACGERDRLEAKLTTVQRRHKEMEARLDEMDKKDGATIEFLRKQLRFRDEQLNGKRALWMEHQSQRSSGNQDSDIRDPFATPTARGHPRTRMGKHLTKSSEKIQLTAGASKSGLLERSQLEDGGPELKYEFRRYRDKDSINPAARVELGDSSIDNSRALVPFKTEEAISQEFYDYFATLYNLVEEWVHSYAHTVNDDPSADHRLSHDPDIWPFMLSCTYEDFTQAHDLTILLLRNPVTRPSFVIRVIIQYFYVSIWKATAFSGFNAKYSEELESIDAQLRVKGLEPAQRARLVAAQTQVIQSIVESDTYPAFRSQSLATHSKGLRAKVGPLLDEACPRTEAGKALLSIVVRAWDISTKMYTSNHTFIFKFPASGSRFLEPTMECHNPDNQETGHSLQIRQAKVKLAIKPLINMRNDRNRTIFAKKIYDSHVLIFP